MLLRESGNRIIIFTIENNYYREEREQNECAVFDAVGDYKCPPGMTVEDVPAVVKIKARKERLCHRLIAHKFNTGWSVVW